MNKKQGTEEKICAFYASDYHFEMISLPYINKQIEDNKQVIILTENNLEETINTVISKINLKEDKKIKILNISWKNDDFNKMKEIKEAVKDEKETVIFIKGKKNYIKNINENIERWVQKSGKLKLIDCYDLEEISGNLDGVMEQYKKVLGTTGEKDIQNI